MSEDKKVLVVYGTRPEAIKLAPVVAAIAASPGLSVTVAVTGQHREMLDQVNALFGIVPDHDLDILSTRQTLTEVTTRALSGLTAVLAENRPDVVVVQGDTTTSFVGALAAFYQQIPVVHVEAGLRTGVRNNPFPEEINRRLTAQLTDLHLAATPAARANLIAEGVKPADIAVTGNTVIDALLWTVDQRVPYVDARIPALLERCEHIVLVTAHRRESWGAPMERVARALATLTSANPDLGVVLPAHPNPVVRETLLPPLRERDNVLIVDPLPYGEFCRLMNDSDLLLTDSGGVQEEGPSLGKPVLVIRDTTERPEGVAAGVARLVGTQTGAIIEAVRRELSNDSRRILVDATTSPYGDGRASARSTAAIRALLTMGSRIADFTPREATENTPSTIDS